MIYVFDVFCKYPCKACDAACNGCSKCMNEVCGSCSQICEPCAKVLDRPLGGYVLMTGAVTLTAAIFAGIGLGDRELRACSNPMTAFCAANVFLGFVHTGFALYLQHRLVNGMQSQTFMGQQGQTLTAGPTAAAVAPQQMPTSKELMHRAGQILLYDIGFCVYVFVFIGAFAFNCAGMGWASECQGATLPNVSGAFMLLYAWLAVTFAVLWYCSMACDSFCGSLFKTKPQPQPAQQNRGLARVIFGKTMLGAPVAQMMSPGTAGVVQPTHPPLPGPVYGQPVAAAAAGAGPTPTAYGSPQGKPGAPTAQERARQGVGQGVAMAGQALQGIGRMIGGTRKS